MKYVVQNGVYWSGMHKHWWVGELRAALAEEIVICTKEMFNATQTEKTKAKA